MKKASPFRGDHMLKVLCSTAGEGINKRLQGNYAFSAVVPGLSHLVLADLCAYACDLGYDMVG